MLRCTVLGPVAIVAVNVSNLPESVASFLCTYVDDTIGRKTGVM